ncbi:bifunctional diaminohydroxyphosphoribosylaminopyrimidine deaminase/5-amino-6-(5-phosphoribosylamino)uracil reductase RibD [Methylopila jiangsuensis]|nr:bifunctional diaminohydroxyphosphoribosylaminopyrimidine deaminase/5-amino-6-(5-phosphoribosylamino)uracil reductase RibD [Methylopila jiangsuensis]
MSVAVALGRRGLGRTAPNPSVGAVLVRPGTGDGTVVGRGWTQPGGRPHAEAMALAQAGDRARGSTLYVTLEPCSHHGRTPPCVEAVIAAGVARAVVAAADPDPRVNGRGFAMLRQAGVPVTFGVGGDDARELNAGHVSRVVRGRPHVTLKLAVSSDGKAGLAGRRPVAITGELSRAYVHMLRAQSDAIMVGIGTVLADDPDLTCRLPGLADRSPSRVALDSDLKLPPASKLAASASAVPTTVISAADAPTDRERQLVARGVMVLRVARANGHVDLTETLALLGAQGVTRLFVEGGPTLAAALLRADLVDEVVLGQAPAPLGPDAIAALDALPLAAITASERFAPVDERTIGPDVWRRFTRA